MHFDVNGLDVFYKDHLTVKYWIAEQGYGFASGEFPWPVMVHIAALHGSGIEDAPMRGTRFAASVRWRRGRAIAHSLRYLD